MRAGTGQGGAGTPPPPAAARAAAAMCRARCTHAQHNIMLCVEDALLLARLGLLLATWRQRLRLLTPLLCLLGSPAA